VADRVCLALGRSLSSPVYTTDCNWEDRADDFGVTVVVIR
jgi:PIN domain nuclease of toxin-antitoxin system